jgi:hypothetical protein
MKKGIKMYIQQRQNRIVLECRGGRLTEADPGLRLGPIYLRLLYAGTLQHLRILGCSTPAMWTSTIHSWTTSLLPRLGLAHQPLLLD